ncbi:MAG: class F sortase [Marmoricola sp.]
MTRGRHAGPRHRTRAWLAVPLVVAAAAGTSAVETGAGAVSARGRAEGVPTALATVLPPTAVAPAPRPVRAGSGGLVVRGAGGVLRIPSLGVAAPVDAVGLDGTTMVVPDDPGRIGWLTTTAGPGAAQGASVLAGHVSDPHDDPGALWALATIRTGALISWTDQRGHQRTFVVTGQQRFPRSRGVPASTFAVGGARVLHLVTCADRRSTTGGGFHYAANLVVTAVLQRRTRATATPGTG